MRITRGAIVAVVLLGACASDDGGDADDAAATDSGGETSGGATSPATTTSPADDDGSATSADTAMPTDDGDDDVDDSGPGETTAGDTTAGDDTTTGTSDRPGPDFREPGPHEVGTEDGDVELPGCGMGYTVFAPTDVADAPTVVLAHGFMGNRGSMAGRAEHLASWGLRVVTPDLCHATFFDPDHAQNGADLVALVDVLELGPVAYAGYSAGGLAAVLATAADAEAIALVGLDMVDNADLGANAASDIAVPAANVVAEPAMCNTSGNGVAVFGAIAGADRLRVVDADHCDFQDPPDAFCAACSAPNAEQTPEDVQATLRGLVTAALVWRTGVDPTGAQWWSPGGPWYDLLSGEGRIVAP